MKTFYLIGNSIQKSLSPKIHNWVYESLDIQAIYSRRNIPRAEFNHSIKKIFNDMKSNDINGINITNPYKTQIISPAISMSKDAKKINAVNCIYNKNNKLMGDNTDWQGFLKSLTYHDINLQDYNILVIGAGGASRSIIYSLQKEKINDFQIYNRTNINNFEVGDVNYNILDINDIRKNRLTNLLIINCVTVSALDNNVIIPDEIFKNIKIFYDLNYLPSRIHSILENEDIQIINGLEMLIYQAIKSIELWSNERIIDEINIEEVKKYLMKSDKC